MRTDATTTVLLAAVSLAGCNQTIVDDFGTASHALVTGSVTRHDGQAYADSPIFISCGVPPSHGFGLEATTNSVGAFRVPLNEPMGPSRTESVLLRCWISAGQPVFAVDTLDILFTPTSAPAHTTMVTIVEE